MLLALLLGVASFALLTAAPLVQRIALAWIVAATVFMGLTVLVLAGGAPERLRERARVQDTGRWAILGIVVAAALASLVAAALLLQKQAGETSGAIALRIVFAGAVVLASWMLTHGVFALHYAHAFYGDRPSRRAQDAGGGLQFPGDQPPDFWDFLYFSLVVGMTCQVSDVQITAKRLRRLATLHGVLSFFFNTVILALTINLIVGAL